jgi:hypothetical protein
VPDKDGINFFHLCAEDVIEAHDPPCAPDEEAPHQPKNPGDGVHLSQKVV